MLLVAVRRSSKHKVEFTPFQLFHILFSTFTSAFTLSNASRYSPQPFPVFDNNTPHFLMFSLLWYYFWISLVIFVQGIPASGCYYSANETVWQSPSMLKGCTSPQADRPVVNCCAIGYNNICLSSHLCFNPDDTHTFYISPCTDPQYESPVCPKYCRKSLSCKRR